MPSIEILSLVTRALELARERGFEPLELRKLGQSYLLLVKDGAYSVWYEAYSDILLHAALIDIMSLPQATLLWSNTKAERCEITESSEEPKLCTCPTFDLVNFGCQCGGV